MTCDGSESLCFFVFGVCLFLCLFADWRGAGKVSKGKGIEGKCWLVGCLCLYAWGKAGCV
jgi:hypothetical protein